MGIILWDRVHRSINDHERTVKRRRKRAVASAKKKAIKDQAHADAIGHFDAVALAVADLKAGGSGDSVVQPEQVARRKAKKPARNLDPDRDVVQLACNLPPARRMNSPRKDAPVAAVNHAMLLQDIELLNTAGGLADRVAAAPQTSKLRKRKMPSAEKRDAARMKKDVQRSVQKVVNAAQEDQMRELRRGSNSPTASASAELAQPRQSVNVTAAPCPRPNSKLVQRQERAELWEEMAACHRNGEFVGYGGDDYSANAGEFTPDKNDENDADDEQARYLTNGSSSPTSSERERWYGGAKGDGGGRESDPTRRLLFEHNLLRDSMHQSSVEQSTPPVTVEAVQQPGGQLEPSENKSSADPQPQRQIVPSENVPPGADASLQPSEKMPPGDEASPQPSEAVPPAHGNDGSLILPSSENVLPVDADIHTASGHSGPSSEKAPPDGDRMSGEQPLLAAREQDVSADKGDEDPAAPGADVDDSSECDSSVGSHQRSSTPRDGASGSQTHEAEHDASPVGSERGSREAVRVEEAPKRPRRTTTPKPKSYDEASHQLKVRYSSVGSPLTGCNDDDGMDSGVHAS
jgi:hypothetical protein